MFRVTKASRNEMKSKRPEDVKGAQPKKEVLHYRRGELKLSVKILKRNVKGENLLTLTLSNGFRGRTSAIRERRLDSIQRFTSRKNEGAFACCGGHFYDAGIV